MGERIDNIIKKAKEFFALMRDKEVPSLYKLIPVLGGLYLIYPFDFITDILPILGQVDDLAIISATVAIFIKMASKAKNKQK